MGEEGRLSRRVPRAAELVAIRNLSVSRHASGAPARRGPEQRSGPAWGRNVALGPKRREAVRVPANEGLVSSNHFRSDLDAAEIGIGFANARSVDVGNERDIPLSRN